MSNSYKVKFAVYGGTENDSPYKSTAEDVSQQLQAHLDNESVELCISNLAKSPNEGVGPYPPFKDPDLGTTKGFSAIVSVNGIDQYFACPEGKTIDFSNCTKNLILSEITEPGGYEFTPSVNGYATVILKAGGGAGGGGPSDPQQNGGSGGGGGGGSIVQAVELQANVLYRCSVGKGGVITNLIGGSGGDSSLMGHGLIGINVHGGKGGSPCNGHIGGAGGDGGNPNGGGGGGGGAGVLTYSPLIQGGVGGCGGSTLGGSGGHGGSYNSSPESTIMAAAGGGGGAGGSLDIGVNGGNGGGDNPTPGSGAKVEKNFETQLSPGGGRGAYGVGPGNFPNVACGSGGGGGGACLTSDNDASGLGGMGACNLNASNGNDGKIIISFQEKLEFKKTSK